MSNKMNAWMGFDSMSGRLISGQTPNERHGLVMPGSSMYLINRPQVQWWRGKRLFVHRPFASCFLIHSIRVGNRETTVAHGPVPADAFALEIENGIEFLKKDGVVEVRIGESGLEIMGTEWELPVCPIGTEVTLHVENISDSPRRFIAGFLGEAPSF